MQNTKNSVEQVLSRRLRPIYDAIDAGQYKKAILEADKVLKKHPQISGARVSIFFSIYLPRMFKALKALALIRTGYFYFIILLVSKLSMIFLNFRTRP